MEPRPPVECQRRLWVRRQDHPALCQVTTATSAPTCRAVSLSPDPPPPPSPPEKPKLATADRQIRQEDRLKTIRLRMAIGRELDERGITTPAAIGEALGMPAAEAVKLMTGRRWREDGVALLKAAAAQPHPAVRAS
jgi:predicted flap endonuclease-1-like 5' DNA nuclease